MRSLSHRIFRWIEHGRGKPVLFLHGLVGRPDDWSVVLERLGRTHRAMALRLPIFDVGAVEPSIGALSRYVGEFLDAVDLPPAVLGGNSLGGHIALDVALRDAGRIDGLVLTGSSGLTGPSVVHSVPRRLSREYLRGQIEGVFHDRSLVTEELVECVRAVVAPMASLLTALRMIRSVRRTVLDDRLHALRLPVLLVWGNNDRITPPDTAGRFRALLPSAEVVLLDSCGHAAMLERPTAFAASVDTWLSRRGLTAGERSPRTAPAVRFASGSVPS